MRLFRMISLLALGIFTFHMSCESRQPQCLSSSQNAIVNGTVISQPSVPAQVVLIMIGSFPSGYFCTGVLITNDWILTAQHCIKDTDVANYSVFLGAHLTPLFLSLPPAPDTQVKKVDRLLPANFLDTGLLHVKEPFMVNNSTTGYQIDIYSDKAETLLGKKLTITGYGCTRRDGVGADGQLRQAELTVNKVTLFNFSFQKNSLDQSPCSGDSGAPFLLPGSHTLVGFHSAGDTEGNSVGIPSPYFRKWVLSQIFPGSTSPCD